MKNGLLLLMLTQTVMMMTVYLHSRVSLLLKSVICDIYAMVFLNNRHNTGGNDVFVAQISISLYICLSSLSSLSTHWAVFHLELNRYDICFPPVNFLAFYLYLSLPLTCPHLFKCLPLSRNVGFCRCPCAVGDGGGRARREGADAPTPAPHALNAAIDRRLEPPRSCVKVKSRQTQMK